MMRAMRRSPSVPAALLAHVAALVLYGCSDGNARFDVRPSVEQLYVTHASPGLELAVHDSAGRAVASGKTDALGSLVFRNLTAGSGYTVRTTTARPAQISRHVTVMSVANS